MIYELSININRSILTRVCTYPSPNKIRPDMIISALPAEFQFLYINRNIVFSTFVLLLYLMNVKHYSHLLYCESQLVIVMPLSFLKLLLLFFFSSLVRLTVTSHPYVKNHKTKPPHAVFSNVLQLKAWLQQGKFKC